MRTFLAAGFSLLLSAPAWGADTLPSSYNPAGAGVAMSEGKYTTPIKPSGVLCSIAAANFNSTADQACAIPASITAWVPTAIKVTNCSASFAISAVAGGVYPAAAKAGTPLVAAAQVYTALTSSSVILPLTLAAGIVTTRYTVNTVYLSLSVVNGSAATCQFVLLGDDLS